jgi:hypothetical protein
VNLPIGPAICQQNREWRARYRASLPECVDRFLTQDAIVGDHPDINLKSVTRIRKRQQRCDELSGKIILDNPSWNMMHADVFIGIEKNRSCLVGK